MTVFAVIILILAFNKMTNPSGWGLDKPKVEEHQYENFSKATIQGTS